MSFFTSRRNGVGSCFHGAASGHGERHALHRTRRRGQRFERSDPSIALAVHGGPTGVEQDEGAFGLRFGHRRGQRFPPAGQRLRFRRRGCCRSLGRAPSIPHAPVAISSATIPIDAPGL